MSAPRHLWLILPWAAFLALMIGWVGYWHYVAARGEQSLRAWATEQTQDGAQASFARVTRHGFPVLMRLAIHDLAYAPARGGWSASTARADINIELLNPAHVIFAAAAPIQIARSDNEISVLDAESLIASVETRGGALVLGGVEADRLTLDDPAKEGVFRVERLVLNVRPDARAAGDYQVAFDANTILLPRPVRSFEQFGLDVGALRAAIVVTHGAALMQGAAGDSLGPWREAGGVLRFEALALDWGPLQASGSGVGGLDAARRIAGNLTLPIERPGPILSALANGPNVDSSTRRALALLAAGYAISGDGLTLDAEARDGVLRLEGLPVRTLPPAY